MASTQWVGVLVATNILENCIDTLQKNKSIMCLGTTTLAHRHTQTKREKDREREGGEREREKLASQSQR